MIRRKAYADRVTFDASADLLLSEDDDIVVLEIAETTVGNGGLTS